MYTPFTGPRPSDPQPPKQLSVLWRMQGPRSVVVAGTPSWYPATNQQCGTATCFPSEAAWESGFANFGAADYHLTSASSYAAAGTDGEDLGANIDALPK